MGVWLPLAMSDLLTMLFALVKILAGEPKEIPGRADNLASWCLPFLSSAAREAEKEQEALALFRSVQNLADRQAAKEGRAK